MPYGRRGRGEQGEAKPYRANVKKATGVASQGYAPNFSWPEGLDERHVEASRLKIVENLSTADIADRLGVSVETIRMWRRSPLQVDASLMALRICSPEILDIAYSALVEIAATNRQSPGVQAASVLLDRVQGTVQRNVRITGAIEQTQRYELTNAELAEIADMGQKALAARADAGLPFDEVDGVEYIEGEVLGVDDV